MNNFVKIQDKFVTQINNSKAQNKMPHAIMVEGDNELLLDMSVNYLLASLFCKETKPCFDCEDCYKVINNQSPDIIIYDLKDETLKKENVLSIQERFSKTALEASNKQVYVIKHIDKASSIVLNALLKFLEEPNENVYAIMTTVNKDKVLATITSRTTIYKLQKNDLNRVKEIFYEDYDKKDVDLIALITNNEIKIREILESDIYQVFKNNINILFESLDSNLFYLRVYELLNEREKEELEIFFDLFYLCLTNKESQTLLELSEDVKTRIYETNNYSILLDAVISSKMELNTNMNKALIVDKFSVEVEGAL